MRSYKKIRYFIQLSLIIIASLFISSCEKDSQFTDNTNIDSLIVKLPNSFSPNGNGLNETYKPVIIYGIYNDTGFVNAKINPIKSALLEIRNNDNMVVFQSSDLNIGWDGKYKSKPLPNETYLAFLHIEGIKGKVLNMQTRLMVVR